MDVVTTDDDDDDDPLVCPTCQGWLDRDQPDARRPDLSVGVCLDCRRWWLIRAEDWGEKPVLEPIAV